MIEPHPITKADRGLLVTDGVGWLLPFKTLDTCGWAHGHAWPNMTYSAHRRTVPNYCKTYQGNLVADWMTSSLQDLVTRGWAHCHAWPTALQDTRVVLFVDTVIIYIMRTCLSACVWGVHWRYTNSSIVYELISLPVWSVAYFSAKSELVKQWFWLLTLSYWPYTLLSHVVWSPILAKTNIP